MGGTAYRCATAVGCHSPLLQEPLDTIARVIAPKYGHGLIHYDRAPLRHRTTARIFGTDGVIGVLPSPMRAAAPVEM